MSRPENIESSCTEDEPTEEKIRRPPNAFMVFAREYRKLVAEKNPTVSNKVISSLLGKIWKETSDDVKKKYYEKANKLRELHKAKYPGYVYCPRDARLQKMKKMKMKMKAQQIVNKIKKSPNAGSLKAQVTRNDASGLNNTKEWKPAPVDVEMPSSPGYIPNNPDYFSEYSEDTSNDESAILVPDPSLDQNPEPWEPKDTSTLTKASSEIDYQAFRNFSNSDSCSSSRTELRSGCNTPYGSGLDVRRFPDHYPYFPSHFPSPFLSPFYGAPRPFAGPMSSYPYGTPYMNPMPQSYSPFPPPYWGLASPRPPPADHNGLYDAAYAPYGQPPDMYPQPFGFYRDIMLKEKINSPYCYGFAEERSYPRSNAAEDGPSGSTAPILSTNVDAVEDKAPKCGSVKNEGSSHFKDRTPVQDPPGTPQKGFSKNAMSEQLKPYTTTPQERFQQDSAFDRRHEQQHKSPNANLPSGGRVQTWYREPEVTSLPRSATSANSRMGPSDQFTVGMDPRSSSAQEELATRVGRSLLSMQSADAYKNKKNEVISIVSGNAHTVGSLGRIQSQADQLRGMSSAGTSIPMEKHVANHETAPLTFQKRYVGTSQTSLGTSYQPQPREGFHLSGPMAANVLYGSHMNLDRNSLVRRKVLDASCQKP